MVFDIPPWYSHPLPLSARGVNSLNRIARGNEHQSVPGLAKIISVEWDEYLKILELNKKYFFLFFIKSLNFECLIS